MSRALARSYRCIVTGCGHASPRSFDVCPDCGMQNSAVASLGSRRDDPEGDPCQALSDYEEARVERIRVCEPWQSLLGPADDPGMPVSEEGTSCLVYGRRGYGKSSLLLRLAASVRGSVVWMALEPGMGPGMVKAYAVRMGLELRDSFRIVEPGSLEDMCSALRARKRMLVVTDSVSTFDYPIQAWKAIREATPGAAFFSIVQVNKQGQMVGSEKLAHLCDTIVRVNKSSLSIPQKNRFGPPCSCPNPEATKVLRVRKVRE